jgi:hypothetical protein
MGMRTLPLPRPLSRPRGRGVSRSAGRGEGSFPQGWRPGLSRLAGPLPGLRYGYPKREDFVSVLLTQDTTGWSWMSPREQKPFRATKEVKRRARREIGSPPPTQRHESRKHKPPKHKQQELQTAEEGT